MKGWIEVHDLLGRRHSLQVCHFEDLAGDDHALLMATASNGEGSYECRESYDEVKRLIEEASK